MRAPLRFFLGGWCCTVGILRSRLRLVFEGEGTQGVVHDGRGCIARVPALEDGVSWVRSGPGRTIST